MTRDNFLNAQEYVPQKEDVFLVDANILVSFFTPFGDHDKTIGEQYEKFILRAHYNSKLVVTSMALSELVYRNLKNKYEIYNRKNNTGITYRDFRKIPEFSEELKRLETVVERQVLRIMEKIDDDFEEIDVMRCFFGPSENFDFSDRYYVQLAKKNNMKILTNDLDFSVIDDVVIVTTNPKFFDQEE